MQTYWSYPKAVGSNLCSYLDRFYSETIEAFPRVSDTVLETGDSKALVGQQLKRNIYYMINYLVQLDSNYNE